MTRSRRNLAILLLLLILAGLVILASGLPGLLLEQGRPFRLTSGDLDRASFQARQNAWRNVLLMVRGLLAVLIIIYPLYILLCLLSERGRKRLLIELVRFALLVWFFNWFTNHGEEFMAQLGLLLPGRRSGLDEMTDVPLAVFDPESAPLWAPRLFLVLAAVLLGALAAAWAWRSYRPAQGRRRNSADQQIADSAQQAIKAIHAGEGLADVILRCYYQMSEALSEHGMPRSEPVTPREFVHTLAGRGLPYDAARELTLLFEEARYGNRPAGPEAQSRALACLSAILAALPKLDGVSEPPAAPDYPARQVTRV